jgi:hypothetical protein
VLSHQRKDTIRIRLQDFKAQFETEYPERAKQPVTEYLFGSRTDTDAHKINESQHQ